MAAVPTEIIATVPFNWLQNHKDEPPPELYGKVCRCLLCLCCFFFVTFESSPQVSQKEYIDDLQEPVQKVPQVKPAMFALCIIPLFGALAFLAHVKHTNKKAKKHVEKVFQEFSEKYEKSRGVRLCLTQTLQKTRKGSAYVDTIQITVKQPGVPIPGIPLFPLSKEGLAAVQEYQNGVQTGGTPMVAAPTPYGTAPMAPADPAYATPAGYPPAVDMPPGSEVDPCMPYPM